MDTKKFLLSFFEQKKCSFSFEAWNQNDLTRLNKWIFTKNRRRIIKCKCQGMKTLWHLQHFQMTLNNKNIKLFTIGCRQTNITSHQTGTKTVFCSSSRRLHLEKGKKRNRRQRKCWREEKENCRDLLGWVRDMALARQKYTHQIMIYFLWYIYFCSGTCKQEKLKTRNNGRQNWFI